MRSYCGQYCGLFTGLILGLLIAFLIGLYSFRGLPNISLEVGTNHIIHFVDCENNLLLIEDGETFTYYALSDDCFKNCSPDAKQVLRLNDDSCEWK